MRRILFALPLLLRPVLFALSGLSAAGGLAVRFILRGRAVASLPLIGPPCIP